MPVTRQRITRGKKSARRSNTYRTAPGTPWGERVIIWLAGWLKVGIGLLFVGVVSVGLLYVYRYVTEQPWFALDEVVITGNGHRNDTDILNLGRVKLGQNIFDLSLERIQQNIENDPWIDKASVRRILPGRLDIHVHERQACFWVIRDNTLWYADDQGQVIDKVVAQNMIALPVLGGNSEGEVQGKAVTELVQGMGAKNLPFGLASLDSLWFAEDGIMTLRMRKPAVTIGIGLREWAANCQRLKLVWDDLHKRQEMQRVKTLQALAGKVWVKVDTGLAQTM